MSSAARMPRWSSTPEYASVPVRSIVCTGLIRPIAAYLLFAPCGPLLSKLSAREITLPFFTSRAAATMSSGCVWFSVPISSAGPHLPQFLYFSAASRRSWRVSLRAGMAFPRVGVGGENRRGATLSHGRFPVEKTSGMPAADCLDRLTELRRRVPYTIPSGASALPERENRHDQGHSDAQSFQARQGFGEEGQAQSPLRDAGAEGGAAEELRLRRRSSGNFHPDVRERRLRRLRHRGQSASDAPLRAHRAGLGPDDHRQNV